MYRTYNQQIKIALSCLCALGLAACASTQKKDATSAEAQASAASSSAADKYDGREPSSMKGEFTWLNEVEDDFGRIAAETSSRAVASQNKHEVLVKQKNYSFSYLPKNNRFYVDLQGTQYQMVQTRIDDGDRYAFAAEGQAENPVTFAVSKGEGRTVASGDACSVEISYWNKQSKAYVTDRQAVQGQKCSHMLSVLKDYVP